MPSSDYFPLRLPSIVHAQESSNWASYFIGRIGTVDGIIDRVSSTSSELALAESFPNNPNAYFGALTSSMASPTSIFLVASTTGTIQIVHHLQHIQSGDVHTSFYGLLGFGSRALPVVIPQEAFILPPEVEALSCSCVMKRMSFSTDGVPDADFLSYSMRPLVPVPEFLSSFILGSGTIGLTGNVSTMDVLRALDTACNSLSNAIDDSRDVQFDWRTDSQFLVPFLFLADSAVPNGFGIELSPVEASRMSPDLASWVSSCHSVLCGNSAATLSAAAITGGATLNPAQRTNTASSAHDAANTNPPAVGQSSTAVSSDMRRMLQDNRKMVEQLGRNFDQSLALQRTMADAYTKEKDGSARAMKQWKSLSADKKRMALAAASTDGEASAVVLPESGMEFLAASVASAKSVLDTYVRTLFPRFMVSYQPLLVLHLHSLMIIWSRSDVPDGFSVFFTPSCRPEVGDSRAAITAGLEAANRAGFSPETVRTQTRTCTAAVPVSYTNLLHQVQNFYALFVVMFGRNSCIALAIGLVVNEIEANEESLTITIESDADFALGFLFNIDNVVQRFLHHLISNDIGVEAMHILSELTGIFGEINAFKFRAPMVPKALRALVRPSDNISPSQSKHSSSGTTTASVPKKQKIKNDHMDARWSLRTDEKFNAFYLKKADAPSILNIPVCLKYHILGTCHSTCPRASTHINLSGDTASQMCAFVNECRSPSSNATPTGPSVPAASMNSLAAHTLGHRRT